MMNRLLGISVMRRLVGGVNESSRYGFSLAALIADDVSSSRWPAGGSSGRRMMNTARGGDKDVDVGGIWPENKHIPEIDDKGWASFQVDLINNPDQNRRVSELTFIFERWCAHYKKTYASQALKKRKFAAFKEIMMLVDGANLEKEGPKLMLTANADLSYTEFEMAQKNNNNLEYGATYFTPPGGEDCVDEDCEKVQEEVDKTGKDDARAVRAEKKETTTDSWKLFDENLKNFPKWRSEEEIRSIFKRWSARYDHSYDEVEEERAFCVFKVKARLTDEYNAKTDGDKMVLDCFCDTPSYCIVRELDADKDPSIVIW